MALLSAFEIKKRSESNRTVLMNAQPARRTSYDCDLDCYGASDGYQEKKMSGLREKLRSARVWYALAFADRQLKL